MVEKLGHCAALGADIPAVEFAIRITFDLGDRLTFTGHQNAAGSAAKPGTIRIDNFCHFLLS
jgi:hypothetical protein